MAVHTPSDNETDLPALPERAVDAHKGSCGRVLLVATSAGMPGAGLLAARAALRAGAGLVTLAVPASLLPVIGGALGCATAVGLPDAGGALAEAAAGPLLAEASSRDAVAVGPGLGRAPGTAALVARVAAELDRPLVLDADALHAVAPRLPALRRREAPTVLTPHPGEAASLLGCSAAEVQRDRPGAARRLAEASGAVVVLKGAGTLIDDGTQRWVNPTGNPGMATGGTGDVLTGVLAALIGQGMKALDAARLGVYIHGAAGDIAARSTGWHALVGDDLVDALPAALIRLGSPTGEGE